MAGKNTAVFGLYSNYSSVETAVDALQAAGFRNTDISVLFPENAGTKDFAVRKGTKAPEGTATGAGTGAVIGGGLGWLAGIGALAIPGLGPFHRSRSDRGRSRRSGSRWRYRWHRRSPHRHGHPGVRSQALRRTHQRRRHSSQRSL